MLVASLEAGDTTMNHTDVIHALVDQCATPNSEECSEPEAGMALPFSLKFQNRGIWSVAVEVGMAVVLSNKMGSQELAKEASLKAWYPSNSHSFPAHPLQGTQSTQNVRHRGGYT